MAQIVKLRRSSVSGQKPTNTNLQLGELALNTTDGKVFMAKSGSLGPTVEELISTNTVNTGSIYLIGDVTASNFSGSFKGDGTNLYNIPASGVTGLNLTRIADGNATASISNTQGLRINTNTEITGSLIVSSGSAVFDAALQLTENSSLILNSGSNLYVYDGGIISGTFKGNGALLTDLPYATTASNQFFGNQTITGSVFITENLTVLGSSSIVYVTSSQLDIATNIIKVNASNPSVRYGGLAVIDSGSSPQVSGSLLFDSIKDEWIFVHQAIVGSPTTSSVFLLGPETYGDLGNETYLTQNRIPKGSGIEHLYDSNISDTGTKVSINSNTEITGSLITTGTIVSETTPLVSGSSQIQITGTTGYSTFSGSISSSIGALSSSIATTDNNQELRLNSIESSTSSLNSFTSSYSTGSFTGSFTGDATNLVNVPFHITGSDVNGNTYDKQFSKLQFDDGTGLNVSESVPGTAFISIGSHFRDIFVSGSGMLRATGSDSFEVIGRGGLDITVNNVDTNDNGYTKELQFNTTNLSSSLDSRISTISGSLSSLNNFTSSVVLTSQTSSMSVLTASYAVTAAFALNAGGAGGGGALLGTYSSLEQTIASATWSFNHNTGQRYPIFQVFNSSGEVIIPTQIRTINENSAEIIFGSAQSGTAIASLGGGNGTTQEFNNSALWTVDHNLGTDYPDVTIWDSNRNIIFPNRIESVDDNQIKVYFSVPVSGHVSVSRGGHILLAGETGLSWNDLQNKPSGLVSGSSQISFNGITDKPTLVSGSSQVLLSSGVWSGSAQLPSGIISGSSQLPSGIISGSSQLPSGLVSGSSQISYTGITNIPSGIVSGSEQLTGSYDTRYMLSGDITGSVGQVAILNSENTATSSWFTHVTNYTFGLGTDAVNNDAPERLMVDNTDSYNIATFQTSQNDTYAEVNIRNFGSGSASSADLVLWNDVSTESSSFLDLGINSSNYNAGYVGYGGDGYLFNHTNDLYIGSMDTLENGHGHVHIFGGGMSDSSSISVYSDGTVGINTDKEDTTASTIPSSVGGYAVEISGSVNFRNDLLVTGSIVVIGDVDASSFNTTSDKLLKTNLERIEGALDKIEQLNGYTFDWIGDYSYDKTRQIGMIANEVHAVQPELTSNRTIMLNDKQEEILLLDYSKVTVLLIEAVKELSDKVKKLEDKLISNGKRGI
jgi:hypothetical protein